MEVVTQNIDWPAEKKDICPKSKLDLHFLPSRSQPVSYRVYSSQISNTSYLSPESASSLKAPVLPTKPVRTTSTLVGKAYLAYTC